ncbi:uncharacterized protein LOC135282427 isoform X1 [Passer domesticus]|uniref:uncharacterized protein LOC135282427 isoform X1 n=1 Tax=Passer domesticus TaxID=48849 RepID=UPI0030FF12B2
MPGPLLWAGWLLAAGCLVGATGSCRHRCCPGRNNVCWAPGARRARCYCDSYCQRTGDCCQDYLATCRRAAVGCAVGPWGPWSGCSSPCGVGSRARSRQVTVPPRLGGDPCPDLQQRRGCLGQQPTCGTAEAALLPAVAKILPSSFSQAFRGPWRRAGLPLPEEPSGYVRGRGPSVTPVPKPGPLLHPLRSRPLCTRRPRAFLLPPAITFLPPPYKTTALCMPHRTTSFLPSKLGSLCTPSEPLPFPPPQPRPLCHSPTPYPLIPQPINKPPPPLPYLPTTVSLFSPPRSPSPAPPSPATAAISAWRRWDPGAAGAPGAAGCSGTRGCACSAGGTRPSAHPAALDTACKEPGHFGWQLLWWGARARGCRRACRRAVSAPHQLSSSCRIPLEGLLFTLGASSLFSIKYFAEEWKNPSDKD